MNAREKQEMQQEFTGVVETLNRLVPQAKFTVEIGSRGIPHVEMEFHGHFMAVCFADVFTLAALIGQAYINGEAAE